MYNVVTAETETAIIDAQSGWAIQSLKAESNYLHEGCLKSLTTDGKLDARINSCNMSLCLKNKYNNHLIIYQCAYSPKWIYTLKVIKNQQ